MHLLSNAALAFAILSCGLLSTTVAAPAPQMLAMGAESDQTSVQSRQCVHSTCRPGQMFEEQPSAPMPMPMQMWTKAHDLVQGFKQNPVNERARIQSRQIMHAVSAEDGDVRKQMLASMEDDRMANDGARQLESRQIMHSMGMEQGDMRNELTPGDTMAEGEEGKVESRQLLHPASEDGQMESMQLKAGDTWTRQVMHSSNSDEGVVDSRDRMSKAEGVDVQTRQVMQSAEKGDADSRQMTA
ncbi:unnamed protein product [Discula destructiva]